jgi:AraC-like DNA-binding protein
MPATGRAADHMAHVWTMRASRCSTAVEAVLPDMTAELYFNLGRFGRHVVGPDASRASSSPRDAWVVGPHTDVMLVAKEIVDCNIVGIRLQPGMIRSVLGVHAAELKGRVLDLDIFWGSDVDRIRQCLFELSEPTDRAALLGREIARRALASCEHEDMEVRALRDAVEAWPSASVRSVADRLGFTHRRVIALFDHYIGLKPKSYQRVHRLRSVLTRIGSGEGVAWARVACEAGYCDQAHLVNEFRTLTGLTPRAFLTSKSGVGDGAVAYCRAADAGARPP